MYCMVTILVRVIVNIFVVLHTTFIFTFIMLLLVKEYKTTALEDAALRKIHKSITEKEKMLAVNIYSYLYPYI